MMRLARHDRSAIERSSRKLQAPGTLASRVAVVTMTLGAFVACADSTVLGVEQGEPDGGAVVPPALDGGDAGLDAASDVTDAEVDADAAIPLCSTDGFCRTVVPKGARLIGVWGDGAGAVWALSSGGDILRWDGSVWNIHRQTGLQGQSIWGSGPTDVWVASGGKLFHGTGASPASLVFAPVTDLPGDPNVPITSVWGTGPDDIWAVGMLENWDDYPSVVTGRVLHFGPLAPSEQPDVGPIGGSGWTSDEEAASMGIGFRAVWGSPATGVWIDGLAFDEESGGLSIRVIRRPKSATEWTTIEGVQGYGFGLQGAALVSDSSVLVSGAIGSEEERYDVTWRGTSSDEGATFTWSYAIQPRWMRAFLAYWGTAADDAWGVGENGLVSHWDGMKWTQAVLRVTGSPVGRDIRAIWGSSNDDIWVVGDEIALHKTNAGKP